MGRDPTKQYTSKPSKKAMKTAKKAFQKQREGAQQTIKQQTKAAKAGQGPYASSYKASTVKQPTVKKGITAAKGAGNFIKEGNWIHALARLYGGDPSKAIKMIGGQYVYDKTAPTLKGLGSKISNFFFSPAGAAEMSQEEYNELLKDAGVTGTTTTDLGPKPDLTDPYIQSKIAGAAGLTTTPQTVGGKKVLGVQVGGDLLNLPTSSSLDAMKQMQIDKRDNLKSLEDVQQKASDFEYPTSLNPEQTKTMYDMVRLQQPGQRTLVANGGLINLFKYGGFLG